MGVELVEANKEGSIHNQIAIHPLDDLVRWDALGFSIDISCY